MNRRIRYFPSVFALAAFLGLVAFPFLSYGGDPTEEKPKEQTMVFKKIGIIHAPYTPEKGAPRQGKLAPEVESRIEMGEEYESALQDIETFSHLIVIYYFDRSKGWKPLVQTPWEKKRHGVFATRSPNRPNPIGMTVVKLLRREGTMLFVQGLDAFDGTPVLDLKPYIKKFDCIENAKGGWMKRAEKESSPRKD